MLSIFSCVSCPSVCLLWRNDYSGFLPIDKVVCFFILSYMNYLHILEINPLSFTSFANIFSHSVGSLFMLFMVSFAMQKLLNLLRFHLFIFVFVFITLGDGSKKIFLWFMSESVLPMFSWDFIVSCLTFRSLTILILFLCMVLGSILFSFL